MMQIDQDSNLSNQLSHEAFELKCHDQSSSIQQWDQAKTKTETHCDTTVHFQVIDDLSKSYHMFWNRIGNYHKYCTVRYSLSCL